MASGFGGSYQGSVVDDADPIGTPGTRPTSGGTAHCRIWL
jgi:hypothetical protein